MIGIIGGNGVAATNFVKPVLKSKKFKFLKYSVSPVNTGNGVVLS